MHAIISVENKKEKEEKIQLVLNLNRYDKIFSGTYQNSINDENDVKVAAIKVMSKLFEGSIDQKIVTIFYLIF